MERGWEGRLLLRSSVTVPLPLYVMMNKSLLAGGVRGPVVGMNLT